MDRRFVVKSLGATALLSAVPTNSVAQAPDYPVFRLGGYKYENGRTDGVDVSSDNGRLFREIGNGHFIWFNLTVTDLAPEQLRIRYRCSFQQKDGSGPPQVSPTYENGSLCPAQDVHYVRAMNFTLAGSMKDDYLLRFGGEIAFRGDSNPRRHYDLMESGRDVWLGTPTGEGGAPDEWVGRVEIVLSRT